MSRLCAQFEGSCGRRFGAIVSAGVLVAFVAGACQSGPEPSRADSLEPVPAAEVGLPPVPAADQLEPLTGEALERARRSLEWILTETSAPDYLRVDAEPATLEEPPLEAQHAYVAGRQAWHQRHTFEAINQFERALRLAPEQPAILRWLGEIYGETGNRVRAAMYLRRAVELDPTDALSVHRLGNFALEQDRGEEAIHLLHHALRRARADDADDPTLRPLLHHDLARALSEAGYMAAAIEQHRHHRATLPEAPLRHGAGAEALMLREHEAPRHWMRVGDMHHQLGEPEAARDAYRRAKGLAEDRDQPVEAALIGRLIYTNLRLGAVDRAGELAIDHIHRTDADDRALAQVRYLTEQGAGGAALADPLREVYEAEGRPASLALAVADLLPGEPGRTLLREHLAQRPHDERVFQGLIRRLLGPEPTAAGAKRFGEAMEVTIDAMAASPEGAEARAEALFELVGGGAALLEHFPSLPEALRERPMADVLHGLARVAAGRTNEAVAPLTAALEADADLKVARVTLARLAMQHGDHAEADELLAPLARRDDPHIVRLRVRVLEHRGELDEALALLDRHLARERDVELILHKAQLQMRAGEAQRAERALLDALNAHPEDERIYAALLDIYDPGDGEAPAIDNAQVQYQRLVRRLLGTMPESRLGRLVRVNLMSARREFDQAERLLREMLEAEPLDIEVLEELIRLYMRSNQPDEAATLIEEKVEANPHRQDLLILAMRLYRETEDTDAALAMGERLLALEPTDIDLVSVLTSLFIWGERPEKATQAIEHALAADVVRQPAELASLLARSMRQEGRGEEAAERLVDLAEQFERHAPDIHCELALLLEAMDEGERAEAVLVETLEAHPDHPRANNALGYTWADRDRNLERAKAMIEIAVEAEPDSAAYLDSLGWVHYKLGNFEEAVEWLERSRQANGGEHPVILDHLGDAYYRLDDHDRARRYWSRASRRLSTIPSVEDHFELRGLDEKLRAKLRALEAGEEPAVASAPGADEPEDGEERDERDEDEGGEAPNERES